MKKSTKIIMAIACGAICGGLGVASGIWSTYAAVFSSFSAGVAILGTLVTGFSVTKV
jgi:uncharacterized membrane protein